VLINSILNLITYNTMEEKLIEALAEALEMDRSTIKPDGVFRDYENYSSLTELSVLAMLDSEFGIEIEMKEFDSLKTVADLVRLITDKQKS
jgi:acyl carrier protein